MFRLMTILCFGIALSSSAFADGTKPHFTFRNHKIGESISNFQYCEDSDAFGKICNEAEPGTIINVGKVPVLTLFYEFDQNKLYGVAMMFGNAYMPDIIGMLEGKYGKPAKVSNEPVQNQAGATFNNHVYTWNFSEGQLVLEERYGRIDKGGLHFDNPTVLAKRGQRQQDDLAKQGQSSF
jgi:hypothetical protein